MLQSVAKELIALNTRFYDAVAQSFSDTRVKPWNGWVTGLKTLFSGHFGDVLTADPSTYAQTITVTDFAAGNLRFEEFMLEFASNFTNKPANISFTAIDNNTEMARTSKLFGQENVNFVAFDILQALLNGRLSLALDNNSVPKAHLTCSFGFFHHIPSHANRVAFLSELCKRTVSGGFVFLSFWGFANNDAARHKAATYTAKALSSLDFTADDLEVGDYFLGWKNEPDIFRYCHNFTESEVDSLLSLVAKSTAITQISKFWADGKDNSQNLYVILQVS